jgi:hypothetical protein
MAKLPPQNPPIRRPALRGRFVVRTWRGKTIVQAWPKPRGENLSPKQKEAVAWFREAAFAAKLSAAPIQNLSREMAKGTQFLPRDLLYKNFAGRLFHLIDTNGRKIYSMAAMQDVSEILDILGQEPGMILVRGEQWWTALPPGPDGSVLAVIGGQPVWLEGGGGGSGGYFNGMTLPSQTPAASTSSWSTKGNLIIPRQTVEITALWAAFDSVGGSDSWFPQIWSLDGPTGAAETVSLIASGPNVPRTAGGLHQYRLPLSAPATLIQGQPYLMAVTLTTGTGTQANLMRALTNDYAGLALNAPVENPFIQMVYGSKVLSSGQAASSFGTGLYILWPEGQFA